MYSGPEPAVVTAVAAQLPDFTEEQVGAVLTAWDSVRTGSPVGTIVCNPENGAIAVRTNNGGVFQWTVTTPDGGTWIDMQPTLSTGSY